MNFKNYPGHGRTYGYSVQTWIAKLVNEYLHSGSYFCWFSMTYNAMRNGDDSNPIWIYLILDRAVAQGGLNNAKVKDVKANLLQVIDRELRVNNRASEVSGALSAVMNAPLDMFTPQLWRIDLGSISAKRYTGNYQYPDEYRITDLKASEFEVIIL